MTKKVVSTRWRLPLPCAHPTAFSQISLSLDRFSREFWVSNKPYKSDSKNWRLEDSISDVLIMFTFFCFIVLWMRTHTEPYFHFRGKKCSKQCSKLMPSEATSPREVTNSLHIDRTGRQKLKLRIFLFSLY